MVAVVVLCAFSAADATVASILRCGVEVVDSGPSGRWQPSSLRDRDASQHRTVRPETVRDDEGGHWLPGDEPPLGAAAWVRHDAGHQEHRFLLSAGDVASVHFDHCHLLGAHRLSLPPPVL